MGLLFRQANLGQRRFNKDAGRDGAAVANAAAAVAKELVLDDPEVV